MFNINLNKHARLFQHKEPEDLNLSKKSILHLLVVVKVKKWSFPNASLIKHHAMKTYGGVEI
jgi:hypothetical protein